MYPPRSELNDAIDDKWLTHTKQRGANKINLMADFNLSIKDDTGSRTRNFSIEDEAKSVQFHLLFSYSGLRAWNVEINETEV